MTCTIYLIPINTDSASHFRAKLSSFTLFTAFTLTSKATDRYIPCFFFFSEAFGGVPHRCLIQKLLSLKLNPLIIRCITEFITNCPSILLLTTPHLHAVTSSRASAKAAYWTHSYFSFLLIIPSIEIHLVPCSVHLVRDKKSKLLVIPRIGDIGRTAFERRIDLYNPLPIQSAYFPYLPQKPWWRPSRLSHRSSLSQP